MARTLWRSVVVGVVVAALALPAAPASACTAIGLLRVGRCGTEQTDRRAPRPQKAKKPSAEEWLLKAINRERARKDLRPLALDAAAGRLAREHAARMAAARRIFHNPALGTKAGQRALGYPSRLGENVGVGQRVSQVHTAFMRSRAHRANVLRRQYRMVGLEVYESRGTLWVVQVFLGRRVRPGQSGSGGAARAGSSSSPEVAVATPPALGTAPDHVVIPSNDSAASTRSALPRVLTSALLLAGPLAIRRRGKRRLRSSRG